MDDGERYGVRAVSDDGLWIIQFKLDGLTISRLPPYTDFEEFAEIARPFVTAFLTVVDPPRVERLALRYINHFRLPYPGNVGDYFVGLIEMPPALPQFVSNLLSRVTIHDPESDFSAHITHGFLDDPDPEQMGFILDVDAFRTAEFPVDEDLLWETYEALRVFKNTIFFELITERNAELHG